MNQPVRDQIELHDSDAVFSYRDQAVVIELCPAYVHHWALVDGAWVGTGRSQAARLVIAGVISPPPLPSEQVELSGGVVRVGTAAFDNLIPVPCGHQGTVRVELELEVAEAMQFVGIGFTADLIGDWTEVESLPAEWAPAGSLE